jgi:hypothetical protein
MISTLAQTFHRWRQEKGHLPSMMLITPFWPQQSWFPALMDLFEMSDLRQGLPVPMDGDMARHSSGTVPGWSWAIWYA